MTEQSGAVRLGFYAKYVKRILDFCCALAAGVLLSPVMLVTALLVRLNLGAPVLFTQERPGRDGKIFKLCKFRSMSNARGPDGALLPDEERLGRFGRLLRSTSLDELPELINILRGDMSIVGPRPLLVRYLPYYTPRERLRHAVLPGLTGYAQIHGRNSAYWTERFEMDVWYAEHVSFLLDVRIILQTVGTVLRREHIDVEMEAFDVCRRQELAEAEAELAGAAGK